MSLSKEDLTVGIEEELFLVDSTSLELCQKWPDAFKKVCHEQHPNQFVSEFLASQVEIVSKPFHSIQALAEHYQSLRATLASHAKQSGLALMASATHPTGQWREQQPTDLSRYKLLENKLQIASRRLLVSGTHIHVGIVCPKQRFYIFRELMAYLPYFLMLSASSPFWGGYETGFSSYRANVMLSLPRSGMPPIFNRAQAYSDYIQALINCGIIESGREVWWDIRLSARFPTIEVRLADTCTLSKTAVAMVALLQSLVRYIIRAQPQTKSFDFIAQNRWCAERYAIGESVFLPSSTLTETTRTQTLQLLDKLYADAVVLGVADYFTHLESVVTTGTSSDKQRQIYQQKIREGASEHEALNAVKRYLCAETLKDINTKTPKQALA